MFASKPSPDKAALVEKTLQEVLTSAKTAFGENLTAAVLFGSAATGQLRITSDVNLMFVLQRFTQPQADEVRETLRLARALIDLHVMFIGADELPLAAQSFPLKFADIQARHKLLWGQNPFAELVIPKADLIHHAKQTLLNFQLRMREQYVLTSLREEQLMHLIADAAAPLRTCAAALRQIRGDHYLSAKEALELLVADLNNPTFTAALQAISQARELGNLPVGSAPQVVMTLLELAHVVYARLNDQ